MTEILDKDNSPVSRVDSNHECQDDFNSFFSVINN